MCLQVGAHAVEVYLVAAQYHDVLLAVALLRHQPHDGLPDVLVDLLGLLGVGEGHLDMSHRRLPVGQALHQLGLAAIGRTHIYLLRQRIVGEGLLFQQPSEEAVVELHHTRGGAVVDVEVHTAVVALGGQRGAVQRHALHTRQGHELAHVALAEAVDGLLAVAHHQTLVALRHAVLHQRHQVVPLQHRGVLELVNQEMVVAVAQALIDEGRRLLAHYLVYQTVELRQVHHLVVLGIEAQLLAELAQQGHRVEVLEQQRARVVVAQPLSVLVGAALGHAHQRTGAQVEVADVVAGLLKVLAQPGVALGTVQLARLQLLGGRLGHGPHIATRQASEIAVVALGAAGAVGLVGPHLLQQLHHRLAARTHLLLETPIVGRQRMVYVGKVTECQLRQRRHIGLRALLEQLRRQRGQFTLHTVALFLLHTAVGEGLHKRRKFLVARRTHQRHQPLHRLRHHLVLVNHHLEVHRSVQVVGKGAHDAVHEAVDGADRQVAVLMQDGRMHFGSHIHQLILRQWIDSIAGLLVQRFEQRAAHRRQRGVGAVRGYLRQAVEHTALHLASGLVGKCNSQDATKLRPQTATEIIRPPTTDHRPPVTIYRHRQLQILLHQRESLAAAGGGLAYNKRI